MTDFPKSARVVIIGGGVVGTSVLYHLALRGVIDTVLLEKNELTAGSTWHAAGNVPTFSTSWSLMNIQRYSTELYARLGDRVDYPINYHTTGSLQLAHNVERMQEFQRIADMGRYQGMDLEILNPKETKARHPFLETHHLAGALFDPNDGDIDPTQLTQALAKGARDLGAKTLLFTPAMGVDRDGDKWVIHTEKGSIIADIVVNAAGYYAQRVGEWFIPHGGRKVPMMVMSHQYILSEEIPELAAYTAKTGVKLPLLRDVDTSYYLRQEKNGFNFGPYETDCRAHWALPDDPMPEDFSFQLYQGDLARLETYMRDAMARVPVLGAAGISKVVNGPIPYTPDGNPLLGPMPGVQNAYEACVFTSGIAQAGGAGKVLAEWITEGFTEWDMWACDPRRFTDHTDHKYCVAKGMEAYGHKYAMRFPHHEWPAGRDKKLSPLHGAIKDMGGQMGGHNGWERANWFAKPGDDTSFEATQTWRRAGPWEARIREECEAVRDHVGVLDLPGLSRFTITGDGAADWLDTIIAGALPKVDRLNLAYFPDKRGRILTEMSVIRHDDNLFTLITTAAAQWHDREMLRNALPLGGKVELYDDTAGTGCLLVTGPKSRNLLAPLTDADLTLPWLSRQVARVAEKHVLLLRVSFAGELGWEIHADNADLPMIYDAVLKAGAKPFGMYALNSLRLEKGYRSWKSDLSTNYTLLEGGLDRFIRLSKPADFPGKSLLKAEFQRRPGKQFVILTLDTNEADAPYMSNLWHDGKIVGETTSGGYGYRICESIALGMIRADLAIPGTEVEVGIYGKMVKAVVQGNSPLWDPKNERLRA